MKKKIILSVALLSVLEAFAGPLRIWPVSELVPKPSKADALAFMPKKQSVETPMVKKLVNQPGFFYENFEIIIFINPLKSNGFRSNILCGTLTL